MNAKHTPGPWKYDTKGYEFASVFVAGKEVAKLCKSSATCEADARLIAAAPDLLAALKACLPMVNAHRRDYLGEGDLAAMNARTAIAAAEGLEEAAP